MTNKDKPEIYVNKEDDLNVLIDRVHMVFKSITQKYFSIPIKENKDSKPTFVRVSYSYLYSTNFLSEFIDCEFDEIKEAITLSTKKKLTSKHNLTSIKDVDNEELISSLIAVYEEIFKDINHIHTFICNYRVNIVDAVDMFMEYCDEIGLANNRVQTVTSLLNSSYFYRENKELHYTTMTGMRDEKRNLPNINIYMKNILNKLNCYMALL